MISQKTKPIQSQFKPNQSQFWAKIKGVKAKQTQFTTLKGANFKRDIYLLTG